MSTAAAADQAAQAAPAAAATPRRGRPGHDLASVLAVAVEVFNERGYDRTSMRDLSRRLGIAQSAIYHHVAGKEELLRLALDRALTGLSEATDRARALDGPAIEAHCARLGPLMDGALTHDGTVVRRYYYRVAYNYRSNAGP